MVGKPEEKIAEDIIGVRLSRPLALSNGPSLALKGNLPAAPVSARQVKSKDVWWPVQQLPC